MEIRKMTSPGIYRIVNKLNGKVYVGCASDLSKRKSRHLKELKEGNHFNEHLNSSCQKYGLENFEFQVIEFLDSTEKLIEREQFWMDKFDSTNKEKGYNKCPIAGRVIGIKRSEEFKIRNSFRQLGHVVTKETREKISKANRIICRTPEFRDGVRKRSLGEKNNLSKLKNKDVLKIKKMILEGVRYKDIAKIFNIDKVTVSNIKTGERWGHLDDDSNMNERLKTFNNYLKGEESGRSKLKEKDVKNIKLLLKTGTPGKEIAEMHGITATTVSDIKKGRTWSHVSI